MHQRGRQLGHRGQHETALVKPGGVIHYYRHLLGRDQAEAAENLDKELSTALASGANWAVRRVREVGPRWIEMVAEIRLVR